MIEWKDNTTYTLTKEDISTYLPLANCPLSSLLNESGKNLLIFPLSFQNCIDRIGTQHLFDIRPCHNGYQLQTGNLAGFIGLDDWQLSIHSHFADEHEKEDFFLHYMLQKVFSVNIFDLKHGTTDEQVFDYLMFLFPYYLNNALLQGLYKEYQWNEYNDSHVKGAIDIHRHIKNNIPFNGCVAYRTREFSHDNHVTQLIRHTIECIRTKRMGETILQGNAETKSNVLQITSATSNYRKQDRMQVVQQNRRPINHPYFTRYAALQKLCLKILRHELLKYGQKEHEIYGVLFDVSWLWEEYLATMLTPRGFKHPNNKWRNDGIYLGCDASNHRKNAFLRYPDFYDKESDGIVVDAKYKKRIDDIHDVNQIITYMYRLKAHLAIFVQPTNEMNVLREYSLKGYGADQNAQLMKYQFQIPIHSLNYKDFKKEMERSEEAFKEFIDSIG